MFDRSALSIDAAGVALELSATIRQQVVSVLRRRGVVVGISGGVDSAVVASLCVRALGPERVLALLMPERDSSIDSRTLGRSLADHLGVRAITESLGPALQAIGCYARQDEAVRAVCPEYGDGWKFKLTLPSLLGTTERLNVFGLVLESPQGEIRRLRLCASGYLQLVAATNFKQRLRQTMEYYHADRLSYAVAGTPNRLEYDQGFFVKQGDGASDLKPIAHLYKTQVYALAAHLEVPEEIRRRPPTTDTFSLAQSQEEFYFSLPYDRMDVCLYALNHGILAAEAAAAVGLSEDQVRRIYADIGAKRRATQYLHRAPLLAYPVPEV
jgi:NAD+ synthase